LRDSNPQPATDKAGGKAMPSYFYHLKFELYPTPDPTTTSTANDRAQKKPPSGHDVWLPSQTTDIFGDLPSHPQTREQQKPI